MQVVIKEGKEIYNVSEDTRSSTKFFNDSIYTMYTYDTVISYLGIQCSAKQRFL